MAKLVFTKNQIGDTLEIDKEVVDSLCTPSMTPSLVNGIGTFVIGVVNCYPEKVSDAVEDLVNQMQEYQHAEAGIDSSTVLMADRVGKTYKVAVYSIRPEIR